MRETKLPHIGAVDIEDCSLTGCKGSALKTETNKTNALIFDLGVF